MSVGALLLAVARPLLPETPRLAAGERDRVERELESFLADEIGAMPLYLRLPFRAALASFDWLPVLRYGQRYTELADGRQRRVVLAWSRSPVGRMRDFVKLVRSCALYFYLDHPLVVARLEEEADEPAARTGASRAN